MNLEEDLRYTESHLWLKQQNGEIEVGLVPPVLDKAEKILFLELPEKGEKVEKGESVAEYEAMKNVGELESPIDGKVVDVNAEIEDEPGKLSEDPYGNWLLRIAPSEEFHPEDYMNVAGAKKYYSEGI